MPAPDQPPALGIRSLQPLIPVLPATNAEGGRLRGRLVRLPILGGG